MRRVSLILLALVVASALAVVPAAARTTSAASTHHKLFVAVKQNMPAGADKKLVVAVNVNQNGGPWASSEATPSKPAVFIQDNSRGYLVKVFLESSCKGVCETKGYTISGVSNAGRSDYATTIIYFEPGQKSRAEYMQQHYLNGADVKPAGNLFTAPVQLTVIVGADQVPSST